MGCRHAGVAHRDRDDRINRPVRQPGQRGDLQVDVEVAVDHFDHRRRTMASDVRGDSPPVPALTSRSWSCAGPPRSKSGGPWRPPRTSNWLNPGLAGTARSPCGPGSHDGHIRGLAHDAACPADDAVLGASAFAYRSRLFWKSGCRSGVPWPIQACRIEARTTPRPPLGRSCRPDRPRPPSASA